MLFRSNEIKNTDNIKKIVSLILTPQPDERNMIVNFSVIQDDGTQVNQTLELGV